MGNDTHVVDHAADAVTEALAAGTDGVQASISYTLPANVETLTLTGTAAINGTGNALNNTLGGNPAANILNGGAGADVMTGGAGNDTYVVDHAADLVTEAASGGDDSIQSTVTYVIPANVENLTLAGLAVTNATGNAQGNWLNGSEATNVLDGGGGNDLVWGAGGNDSLLGGLGNDVLQAGAGNDALADVAGNAVLDGGAGTDTLTGGAGRELFIGGTGSDTITRGSGADVIAFNRGDGADVIRASAGTDDTLSLGGGITYSAMSLTRTGLDLVLDFGNGDQIAFKDWYQAGVNNRSILNLQVVVDAMAGYSASSTDRLLKQRVAQFDFRGIASRFDAALAANPALTRWSVANALAATYVGGSDTAAWGGDLGYEYGHRGSLSGVAMTAADAVLANGSFGAAMQARQPASTLYAAGKQLH
jgi:hypothetical protein